MTLVCGHGDVFVVRDGSVGCGDTVRGGGGHRAVEAIRVRWTASTPSSGRMFSSSRRRGRGRGRRGRATGVVCVVDDGRIAWSAVASLWSENGWDCTARER